MYGELGVCICNSIHTLSPSSVFRTWARVPDALAVLCAAASCACCSWRSPSFCVHCPRNKKKKKKRDLSSRNQRLVKSPSRTRNRTPLGAYRCKVRGGLKGYRSGWTTCIHARAGTCNARRMGWTWHTSGMRSGRIDGGIRMSMITFVGCAPHTRRQREEQRWWVCVCHPRARMRLEGDGIQEHTTPPLPFRSSRTCPSSKRHPNWTRTAQPGVSSG